MFDLTKASPLGLDRAAWPRLSLAFVLLLAILAFVDRTLSAAGQALPEPVVKAFATITDYGLSDWILIPSLALMLLCAGLSYVARKWTVRLALVEMTRLYGFIFVGVGLPGLISNLIKRLIGRGRPEVFDQVGAFRFEWIAHDVAFQSFPSGHTTTSFAFAFVVGFIRPRWLPWLLLIAAAVGVSRVVIGMHYPTDVAAGALLGMLGAYFVRNAFATRRWLFEPMPDGRIRLRPWRATQRLVRRKRPQAK